MAVGLIFIGEHDRDDGLARVAGAAKGFQAYWPRRLFVVLDAHGLVSRKALAAGFGRENAASLHRRLAPPPWERLVDVQLLNPYSEKMTLDDKLSILDIKARDDRGRLFNLELAFA